MLPPFVTNNRAYRSSTHTKLVGELNLGKVASRIKCEYLTHLGLSKFGYRVGFAPRLPFLAVHISDVVQVRTEPEMVRANTWGIIAAMQNMETWRDVPVMQFPRETMGKNGVAMGQPKVSIAFGVFAANPKPTAVRFGRLLDFGKEAINSLFGYTWHVITSVIGDGRTPAVNAARGFYMPNYTTIQART